MLIGGRSLPLDPENECFVHPVITAIENHVQGVAVLANETLKGVQGSASGDACAEVGVGGGGGHRVCSVADLLIIP